eukprot:scaffold211115_cov27-Tisochrysis_lutea.AAC.1
MRRNSASSRCSRARSALRPAIVVGGRAKEAAPAFSPCRLEEQARTLSASAHTSVPRQAHPRAPQQAGLPQPAPRSSPPSSARREAAGRRAEQKAQWEARASRPVPREARSKQHAQSPLSSAWPLSAAHAPLATQCGQARS